MKPIEGLGQRLRKARENCKLLQVELARDCGISRPFLSAIETGKRIPAADVLRDLAVRLQVSTDMLLDVQLVVDHDRRNVFPIVALTPVAEPESRIDIIRRRSASIRRGG